MKKIFLGTPKIAANILEFLIKKGIKFEAIITNLDKPVGRKQVITPPPVKEIALKYNLNIFQPKNKNELDYIISEIKPDYALVVAYGMIIKSETLKKSKIGFFNLHFSLLPSYRGADPIRWAIINGERETGITVFKIDDGIDTGPILLQEKTHIADNEKSFELLSRLSQMGMELLLQSIELIEKGDFVLHQQNGKVSYAPKISIEDTFINFSNYFKDVYNRIRAFSYDPYARFLFNDKGKKVLIQIIDAESSDKDDFSFSPGQIVSFENKKAILVKCLGGCIKINLIKPEGKREMTPYDYFINGKGLRIGDSVL